MGFVIIFSLENLESSVNIDISESRKSTGRKQLTENNWSKIQGGKLVASTGNYLGQIHNISLIM